jgi:urease accessory protein
MHPHESIVPAAWRAELDLRFARRGEATLLAARRQRGPLALQKPLHPEGPSPCHAVVLHPPGGIAAGDALELRCTLDAGAHALLTTPGAGKWYRSGGTEASQQIAIEVGEQACCEWLPQETILFDGARATLDAQIRLAAGGRYLGWEVLVFGRTARGERFAHGRLRLATRLIEDGRLLWAERAALSGGDALLDAAPGLAGRPVSGTMIAAGFDCPDALLAALREACARHEACGVTRLPRVLLARCLGDSAEAVRAHFLRLWTLLRPALAGRQAVPPRIWAT